ncbi:unnamed protein product [Cylindrotheca closterium]|uniref:Uncharacterized protein n=1 Tax=Cylindrotheca closterium TaxID=2856 RepID=A0AAD2CZ52_9STRA|nr:unnamed protein product [Cylindrotheca closterium]
MECILLPSEPDSASQAEISQATLNSQLSTSITCQVEVRCDPSSWSLRTRDDHGKEKQKGGDEMYVRYEEFFHTDDGERVVSLQAVAFIKDNGDGSYDLSFSTTPWYPDMSTDEESEHDRELIIYIEYSNHIGTLPPPQKSKWENGGYTHKKYSCRPHQRPPMQAFKPPFTKGNCMNLSDFDQVFAFGDSTMDQFVRQRPNKKGKYYFQPKLKVGEKMRLPMNSETTDTHLQLLDEQFGPELKASTSSDSTALILGSCLWDILDYQDTLQGSDYANHTEACRNYIEEIQKRYPNVTLVWKSPMAVHIHWVDLDRLIQHEQDTATLFGVDRVRYMSASRSKFLYQLQTKLMKELQIPVLDLFDATYLSADKLYPSDGRHYRPELNRKMLQWFYR